MFQSVFCSHRTSFSLCQSGNKDHFTRQPKSVQQKCSGNLCRDEEGKKWTIWLYHHVRKHGDKKPTKMVLFQAVNKGRWRETWWWNSEMTIKRNKMQSDLGLTGGCACLELQDPLGHPASIYGLHHLLGWHCILGGKSQNILRENIERDPNET